MNSEFLAMWDCEGLECMFDITSAKHDMMIAKLQGKKFLSPPIELLKLRARANSQRQYEIYTFSVEGEVKLEDMKELFNLNPQSIVDLIRKKGNKLYSDYTPIDKKVIS